MLWHKTFSKIDRKKYCNTTEQCLDVGCAKWNMLKEQMKQECAKLGHVLFVVFICVLCTVNSRVKMQNTCTCCIGFWAVPLQLYHWLFNASLSLRHTNTSFDKTVSVCDFRSHGSRKNGNRNWPKWILWDIYKLKLKINQSKALEKWMVTIV